MTTLETLVKVAQNLMIGTDPGDNPEYARGMAELIANAFPTEEPGAAAEDIAVLIGA